MKGRRCVSSPPHDTGKGWFPMPTKFSLTASLEERFWAKVQKTETCWLWTGGKSLDGYGIFRPSHGPRSFRAHRFAYELLIGPIAVGLTLDHLCRVRRCVNPAHLEPVTDRVNILRGISPSAQAARKTHCPQGHPYDLFNTHRNRQNGRVCLECRRLRDMNRPP